MPIESFNEFLLIELKWCGMMIFLHHVYMVGLGIRSLLQHAMFLYFLWKHEEKTFWNEIYKKNCPEGQNALAEIGLCLVVVFKISFVPHFFKNCLVDSFQNLFSGNLKEEKKSLWERCFQILKNCFHQKWIRYQTVNTFVCKNSFPESVLVLPAA